jgi:hypothetical protein
MRRYPSFIKRLIACECLVIADALILSINSLSIED